MMDQAQRLRSIVSEQKNIVPIPRMSDCRVITITSGKGGVGKTNFTINLAIQLKKHNYNVVIIDADFALANVEVLFGIAPKYSIADVINGSMSITEVLTNGPMGIKFISGGTGIRELLKMTDSQMKNLITNFSLLDELADIILIDTGAGVTTNVTNFVKASDETIVITTPEPTSITDAYTLIKLMKTDINYTMPNTKIVVNRVDDETEGAEIFGKLKNVASKFLNVEVELLGYVPFDNNLIRAVKRQEPATITYPNSKFSKSMETIADKLVNNTSRNTKAAGSGFSGFMKKLISNFNK